MSRDVSRLIHDAIFKDTSQSLCARAYERRDVCTFWRVWYRLFGPTHCAKSYEHHRKRNAACRDRSLKDT